MRKIPLLVVFGGVSLVAGCQCTPEQSAAPGESAEEFAERVESANDDGADDFADRIASGPLGAPTGTAQPPEKLVAVSQNAAARLGKTDGGCKFEQGGETVFVAGATSNTDTSGRAVVVINGVERVMGGADLGGAQAIESGPTVGDGEFTVSVIRGEGAPKEPAVNTYQWPAQLVITSGAGQRRYPTGTWTCTTGEAA
ncbi:hypothetical protein [Erythrobacter sp. HKB08]|uniref:hypothetical protein n=1 Tax=Erythrobacter sp. HKB08 TaxID=2502843 RepID=UPI0010089293|nr:hypothetical protein [Erythrobacter sp. HKB08]